jgi:hypothetical protein
VSWLQFASSVIGSLAWPATIVVFVVILRRPVARMLERPPTSLKAGPAGIELLWDDRAREVHDEVARATGEIVPRLAEEFYALARLRPSAVVFQSFGSIEQQLRATLSAAGFEVDRLDNTRVLARLAVHDGLITPEIDEAIEGLTTLRDMLAHDQADVDAGRALDFAALSDTVLDAIEKEAKKRLALEGTKTEEKRLTLEGTKTEEKRLTLEGTKTEENRPALEGVKAEKRAALGGDVDGGEAASSRGDEAGGESG